MGNLDHIVNHLEDGDEIRADYRHSSGTYVVSGIVNREKLITREVIRVGDRAVGYRFVSGHEPLIPFKPSPDLTAITIIKRAQRPWFKGRPTHRVPRKGDLVQTIYGAHYYFDGLFFTRVGNGNAYTLGEFMGERGTLTLISEAV